MNALLYLRCDFWIGIFIVANQLKVTSLDKDKIKEIADNLDFGMRCYIHRETKDLLFIPNRDKNMDVDEELWAVELGKLENDGGSYEEIEAMDSRESFELMVNSTLSQLSN